MAAFNLAPVANWFSTFGSNTAGSSPNIPLSGGKLYTYAAGTVTPLTTYTSSTGAIANSNPIILASDGRPPSPIWLAAGSAYKFVLQDSLGNPIPGGTYDNLVGINDTTGGGGGSSSEWIASGATPTYSSATVFTTPGNTTGTFQVNRRVQATVTAGTVYGTIASAVFGAATTVTLVMDAGMALDNGLTVVNVGILGGLHPSVPGMATGDIFTASQIISTGAMSANGQFSNPGQPAFRASFAGSIGQSSGSTILFPDVSTIPDFQNGAGYNPATGTFTVPYTGVYVVTSEVTISGGVNTDIVQIVRNGTAGSFPLLLDGGSNSRHANSFIMKLNATDTLNVQITFGGPLGAKTISASDATTQFSVALLY